MSVEGFRRTTAARRGELEQAHQARDAAEAASERPSTSSWPPKFPIIAPIFNAHGRIDRALARFISIPGEMNRTLNYVGPLDARALRILDAIYSQGEGLITPMLGLRGDGSQPRRRSARGATAVSCWVKRQSTANRSRQCDG